MKKGEFVLERGGKPFELALLFVRLFRLPANFAMSTVNRLIVGM